MTAVVDINRPVCIELAFEVLRPATNLVTGVSFYSEDGACLFAHCDWRPNELHPGKYRKVARVPATTFAEGRIAVLAQLVFFEPDVRSVVIPECLRFQAVDSDALGSVRGPYKGTWPGAVRLAVDWCDAVGYSGGAAYEAAAAGARASTLRGCRCED